MKLPIRLPSFHYLISPRIGSSSWQNSSFLPKPVAQKTPLLCQPWRSLLPLAPTPLEIPLLPLLPLPLLPFSASSIDPTSETRESTPEWDPTAAYEALAPLHWDAEEFDFGVASEEDEPTTEGEEDLQL